MPPLTIGVVLPQTGRLSKLGDPLAFVTSLLAARLSRITNSGRQYELRVVSRDSHSKPERARQATEELIRDEEAHIILTLAGTEVLPVVADTCESLEVPCLSSTFPWQVYYYGRGANTDRPFRWTYHFCWGLDDIAAVFADMWKVADAEQVGSLWNDGPQGTWSRHSKVGFRPVASARGYKIVDPGGYTEPSIDFSRWISAFLDHGVDVVTSAATEADLTLFHRQAAEHGLAPRLITCSRWLAYPPADTGLPIATLAYWTPQHPYRSSLDGMSTAELAEQYEQASAKQWLQPLGLAYALFEVAAHALSSAEDPSDRAAVAKALSTARLDTIAGPLDWNRGPVTNVATIRLAGAQWKAGTRHKSELAIVTNTNIPEVPVEADLAVRLNR